jgi:hypothetical protein
MYIRAYIFDFFLQKMPLSYTMVSVLLRIHLKAFAMEALGREAINSMIFNIREPQSFGWNIQYKKRLKYQCPQDHGLGSKGVRKDLNFAKDHAIH